MSILRSLTFDCPSCQTPVKAAVYDSINAARRPDLRDAVLSGSLHQTECPGCNAILRAPPSLTYLDLPKGVVVIAFPAEDRNEWTQAVDDARRTLDRAFGHGPGPQLLSEVEARIVFGWAALREKVLIAEAGLSDVNVEIIKLALTRSAEELPVFDDLDLRLTQVDNGTLTFSWVDVETGDETETLTVPADTARSIEPEAEAWQPLRAELSATPFVDHSRFVLA